MTLSYALVTPARNEARNLPRLARCLDRQTAPPEAWLVVDDGSTDETSVVAAWLAAARPWLRVLDAPAADGELGAGRRTGRDIVAFKAGVAALGELPDVVLKLDADVSFAPDFFELLLAEFESDERLGIAGGTCLELRRGRWTPYAVTGGHVRGATRAYRRECFRDVSPLAERLGWEAIDEARAALHGWTTRSIEHVEFRHHRLLGERDGARRAWVALGHAAHHLGYRIPFMLLKVAFRVPREPAALAMLWGYAESAFRREPRHAEPEVVAHVRRTQSLRALPLRVRQALGARP